AVLLSATGKLFCAGGDLASFAEKGDAISEELKKVTFFAHDAFIRLMRMPAPVVTAVNGAAAGIGLSLALIGDVTIASSKASFTSAYTAAGLSPDGGCTSLLVELVGTKRAKELMLCNRRLSASEALDWGMINRVVEPEALESAALELANTFAAGPTKAFGAVKRLVLSAAKNNIEAQMTSESRMIAANAKTQDGKEGIAAFLEKRKPNFLGY
ncbi:MAG: enoyl-CoA hydratase/isomerase family protein, partial [Pseudomonadales bacterium]|nr:enoyl-CoA hydratase/isomerase family protein [Pseudomonadales bacterium]